MKRGDPLKCTPLKRGGYLGRSSPLPKVNRKRKAKRAKVNWPQRDRCRRLPCASCGRPGPSDPAHIRTRASLAGSPPSVVDRANVIPLCRICHTVQGTMPIHQFDEDCMPGETTMQRVADEIAEHLADEGTVWE